MCHVGTLSVSLLKKWNDTPGKCGYPGLIGYHKS